MSAAPTSNLCSPGVASSITGSGNPWRWMCSQPNGTVTNCWATKTAYYVNPDPNIGSDSNNGTSPQTPFATLTKAQTSMQGGSTKITYLMAGYYSTISSYVTYTGGPTWYGHLNLRSSDSNETWAAMPGDRPILDCGNASNSNSIYISGATGVTVDGLTVQNCSLGGIYATATNGITVKNNSLFNITSPVWSTAVDSSIFFENVYNSTITHNLIDGNTNDGMEVNNGGPGDDNTNDVVSYNIVRNTCLSVADCGGIYFRDVGHNDTRQVINNNLVYNFGNIGYSTGNGQQSKGLYLDDESSNIIVTNNIVYGTGTWDLAIHGGNNNTFANNIFDLSLAGAMGLYQDDSPGTNYGMAGNALNCNIIYSSASAGQSIWTNWIAAGVTVALPSFTNNVYFNTNGSFTYSASGSGISDPSQTIVNPNFMNAGSNNYAFSGSSPNPSSCFIPIDTTQYGPQWK